VAKCIKNGDGEFGAVWALLVETAVSEFAYALRLQADIPGLQREMIGRCLQSLVAKKPNEDVAKKRVSNFLCSATEIDSKNFEAVNSPVLALVDPDNADPADLHASIAKAKSTADEFTWWNAIFQQSGVAIKLLQKAEEVCADHEETKATCNKWEEQSQIAAAKLGPMRQVQAGGGGVVAVIPEMRTLVKVLQDGQKCLQAVKQKTGKILEVQVGVIQLLWLKLSRLTFAINPGEVSDVIAKIWQPNADSAFCTAFWRTRNIKNKVRKSLLSPGHQP